MPDGNPTIYGKWRTADPTLDPNVAPRPTRTPGSRTFTTNANGSFSPDNTGVFAVHMALMHTGNVLMFSGHSESDNSMHRSWSWDPTKAPSTAIGRWVVEGYPHTPPWAVVPGGNEDPDSDLFCAHHVFLADGKLLVLGGDRYGHGGHTNASVHIYDPVKEQWTKLKDQMQFGRWYPTAVLLADGSALVFSGLSASPGAGGIDSTIEHLQPSDFTPKTIIGGERIVDGNISPLQSYPSLHLVAGGKVYYTFASWQYAGGAGPDPAARIADMNLKLGDTSSFQLKDPATWADANIPEGDWEYYANSPNQKLREEGTSVLLAPAQDGKIMIIGGGWWDQGTQRGAAKSCEILETQNTPPVWSNAGEMHLPRVNANAVLLPDGKVLLFGGHEKYKRNHDSAHPSNEAEIYDPKVAPTAADPNAAFTKVAIMKTSRMYHATGVLLPDATVLVAGGEDGGGHDTFGFGIDQTSMEIFEPPYCHQTARPVISGISETDVNPYTIRYDGKFTILTSNANDIDLNVGGVVLIRPGCTTHHTDSEQRVVYLTASITADGLRVNCPSDPNIAPPGYYMVFIVNTNGIPCERAKFVRLCSIPKDACVAPLFEPSNWFLCFLMILAAPFVIIVFILLIAFIAILEMFFRGILARFICQFRKYLFRLNHCHRGNSNGCVMLN